MSVCVFFCCKSVVDKYVAESKDKVLFEMALKDRILMKFETKQPYMLGCITIDNHFIAYLPEKENKLPTPMLTSIGQAICIEVNGGGGIGKLTNCIELSREVTKMLALTDPDMYTELCQAALAGGMISELIVPKLPNPETLQRILWCCEAHLTESKFIPIRKYQIGNQILTKSVSNLFTEYGKTHIHIPLQYGSKLIHTLITLAESPVECKDLRDALRRSFTQKLRTRSEAVPRELFSCQVCSKEYVKACKCGKVWYCGTECQTLDSKKHGC